jgi:hypothetical protein
MIIVAAATKSPAIAAGELSSEAQREPRSWSLCRSQARRLSPKVLKAIRRQLGVAHRMLDIAVPEICLQGAGVVALIGEGEATGVP